MSTLMPQHIDLHISAEIAEKDANYIAERLRDFARDLIDDSLPVPAATASINIERDSG